MTATLDDIYQLTKAIAVKVGVELPSATTTTTPAPIVTTTTRPPASAILQFPAGMVRSRRPGGQPWNIPWSQVARWEPLYTQAGEEFGVAPLLLAAFSMVESDANHYRTGQKTGTRNQVVTAGPNDRPSVGIMQIVCYYHGASLPDADCWTPEGNIRLAAKLLRDWMRSEGSWEAALTNRYHPGTDPASGVSPETYIRAVRDIIAEVKASWGTGPSGPTGAGGSGVTGTTGTSSPLGSPYSVAGLSTPILLPFPLWQAIIPTSQWRQRPAQGMRPDRWVQHDTGNRQTGANAAAHRRYLEQGAPDEFGNPQQLSYHFSVDDREAWQMIPVDEVAWHGGDGSGPCNMRGVSCELCINADSDEARSRTNAAVLAAELMNALNIDSLKKHQDCSSKYCPRDMLNDGYWPTFVSRVNQYRQERKR